MESLQLRIYNPRIDLSFIPICGALNFSYNGMRICMHVHGTTVYSYLRTPEYEGELNLAIDKDKKYSWQDLIQLALGEAIFRTVQTAVMEIEFLKMEGIYRVQ